MFYSTLAHIFMTYLIWRFFEKTVIIKYVIKQSRHNLVRQIKFELNLASNIFIIYCCSCSIFSIIFIHNKINTTICDSFWGSPTHGNTRESMRIRQMKKTKQNSIFKHYIFTFFWNLFYYLSNNFNLVKTLYLIWRT